VSKLNPLWVHSPRLAAIRNRYFRLIHTPLLAAGLLILPPADLSSSIHCLRYSPLVNCCKDTGFCNSILCHFLVLCEKARIYSAQNSTPKKAGYNEDKQYRR
jgi:hypothetical protein